MIGDSDRLRLLGYGVAVGLAYGLSLRFLAHMYPLNRFFTVMSVSFLFLLPFSMGFLTVFLVERKQSQSPWLWVAMSVLPVTGGLLGTVIALWEGVICVVMFAPIGLLCAILGGFAGGAVARFSKKPVLTCIAILPLLVNPWEQKVLARYEVRTVKSSIDIQAPPSVIWNNIKSVSTITPEELKPAWSRKIGFPRPLDATLSREGVGGIRHARFAGGVLFVETVDVWEPQRRLAFSIKAQTADIPPTTLDSHVTVGGPFFDALRGEYAIEHLPDGTSRLHLYSQHRLSTDFNWYAHLWTDAVMADIQNSILRVLRRRCENEQRVRVGQ